MFLRSYSPNLPTFGFFVKSSEYTAKQLEMTTPQFELSDPPSDAISSIKFAPASLRLLVASWDKNVYLYDTSLSGGKLLQTFQHRAPVLDVCFGESDEDAYTTGLDWDVRQSVS